MKGAAFWKFVSCHAIFNLRISLSTPPLARRASVGLRAALVGDAATFVVHLSHHVASELGIVLSLSSSETASIFCGWNWGLFVVCRRRSQRCC